MCSFLSVRIWAPNAAATVLLGFCYTLFSIAQERIPSQGFFHTQSLDLLSISEEDGEDFNHKEIWTNWNNEIFAALSFNEKRRSFLFTKLYDSKGCFVDKRFWVEIPEGIDEKQVGAIQQVVLRERDFIAKTSRFLFFIDSDNNITETKELEWGLRNLIIIDNNYLFEQIPNPKSKNGSIILFDQNFSTINKIADIYQVNASSTILHSNKRIAYKGERIVISFPDSPRVLLTDKNLTPLDTLILTISNYVNDTLQSYGFEDSVQGILFAMQNGFTKFHDITFINDTLLVLGYWQNMNCGGEVLIKLNADVMEVLETRETDRGCYWFAIPDFKNKKLGLGEIQYHYQLFNSSFLNNSLYSLQEGKSISPVGISQEEWHNYNDLPGRKLELNYYAIRQSFLLK